MTGPAPFWAQHAELAEWRPVIGWEGLYEVSDHGQVRSIDRTVTYTDGRQRRYASRVLTPGTHGIGHLHVMLCGRGVQRTMQVHRLVLEAFIGPMPDGMEALHGPGGPGDNRLQNLRWGTRGENNRDKRRDGTDHNVNKTHCPQGHPYSAENTYIYPTGNRRCRICRREANRRYETRRAAS